MTSPSILNKAKETGLSWDIGKGHDTFLPLSSFIPKEAIKNPHDLELELEVNKELRQKGNTKDLNYGIPEIIEYLSSIFTLEDGDLILSGTPPGSSPVKPGDVLHGKLIQDGQVIKELIANIK